MPTTILWLRRDLRRTDHPALLTAAEAGDHVLPLFVLDPALHGRSEVRDACLAEALADVASGYDGALVVRSGDPATVLPEVVREVRAASVHVSVETTPHGRRRDQAVRRALGEVPLVATGSPYAVGPGLVRTREGGGYQVFTPFRRAWSAHGWPAPAPEPGRLRWHRQAESEPLPAPSPAGRGHVVGEQAARRQWEHFLQERLGDYAEHRDRPDLAGTSRMSVPLKWGSVHPRTLLADLAPRRGTGKDAFVAELAWREFYADLLWRVPSSSWQDLHRLPLDYDDPEDPGAAAALRAWREGRTGYPFVDAGMRQLAETGWMHNRLRMVTASFLVKQLHLWWPVGARHFLDRLADGDLASNSHGWQWVAGTGTDAAPYFRVFNPVTQGRRFDPDGELVRRWVPELQHLPGGSVHEPWRAGRGYARGYPERVVDHASARREALERYERARSR